MHLPCISPAPPLHLPYISPASPLHLPCISPAPPHLPHISAASPGLGLELDATNTVINVVKGAAADVQGYFRIGDTIASLTLTPTLSLTLTLTLTLPSA